MSFHMIVTLAFGTLREQKLFWVGGRILRVQESVERSLQEGPGMCLQQ